MRMTGRALGEKPEYAIAFPSGEIAGAGERPGRSPPFSGTVKRRTVPCRLRSEVRHSIAATAAAATTIATAANAMRDVTPRVRSAAEGSAAEDWLSRASQN